MKRALFFATKLLISATLLAAVVHWVDLPAIKTRLLTTDFTWLVPALLTGPIVVLLSAWRWHHLSNGLVPFGQAVRYTWIGIFFGTFLPGLVGGDVAKGLSLAAKDARTRDVRLPVSILVDKIVGFWALLLCFAAASLALLATQPQVLAATRSAVITGIVLCGAGLLTSFLACHEGLMRRALTFVPPVRPPGLARVVDTLKQVSLSFAGRGRQLAAAAAVSLVIHLLNATAMWCALRALSIPATFAFAALFYPALTGVLVLPVSISGVGVRDVFAVGMFTAFGLGADAAVAFAWLLLALAIPNVCLGGCVQCYELITLRSARSSNATA